MPMTDADARVRQLADLIVQKSAGAPRYMVAIAGPPGSGKSTLSGKLQEALTAAGERAVVVPMDGFHFDDIVLNARGHRPRKGAPFTFDAAGFEVLLKRIRSREPDIAIPVFDRSIELARAGADIVSADARIILIEGNYLLLNRPPWSSMRQHFDFTIFLSVPRQELERRLMERWQFHGFDRAHGAAWIASNDMPNIMEVLDNSTTADLTL